MCLVTICIKSSFEDTAEVSQITFPFANNAREEKDCSLNFFENALNEKRQEAFIFLKMALPFLKDVKIISTVIERCLELYSARKNRRNQRY